MRKHLRPPAFLFLSVPRQNALHYFLSRTSITLIVSVPSPIITGTP